MINMSRYRGLKTHVLGKKSDNPIFVGPLPSLDKVKLVTSVGTDYGSLIQRVCKERGMVCCVPLDSGYTIDPDNYVYIKPTKDMDVTTLKIPVCRGIVIESGYEDSRSLKKHNEFRCHFDIKPAEQTFFRFE